MSQLAIADFEKQEWTFHPASVPIDELEKALQSSKEGLSKTTAAKRLKICGLNTLDTGRNKKVILELLKKFVSPLVILLIAISIFSYIFGQTVSAIVIAGMIAMSVGLSFMEERKAEKAARRLEDMVQATCSVIRDGRTVRIPSREVVPGDIVSLAAGDLLPGDTRIISCNDFFVNQSSLTGESFPSEKFAMQVDVGTTIGLNSMSPDTKNMAFMGSSVVSGFGTGIIVHTGQHTAFGQMSKKLSMNHEDTLFDRQIRDFTWLSIKIIGIVVLLILGIYAAVRHNIFESLLFALAVAVQITPETMPMIVTINLSRGALAMSRRKAIVRRLNSLQNLGAMDLLCSDKTGTLTKNEIVLEKYVNISGKEDESVLRYGYMNSYYQTGLKNLLTAAVLKHGHEDLHGLKKVDEIPFDFERKITSVIVKSDEEMMISVGAPEEIVKRCVGYEMGKVIGKIDAPTDDHVLKQYYELSKEGYRVLAVAHKTVHDKPTDYTPSEEKDLVLKGYMAFMDPPKSSAKTDIDRLERYGIAFKIVTGDNEFVTEKVCKDLKIPVKGIVLGSKVDKLSDKELAKIAEEVTIFARVSPEQKERVVKALKLRGHVVGYLGDGINDALSLRAADVGISVNNGVDVAKESAGIVLLEKNLVALADGVMEGRKVFGNFMKYIRMTSMVNVGYVISTVAATMLLPFLPMAPVQMLLNNFMYEVGQTGIPSDNVDKEYLTRPRKWHISSVFKSMVILGPISSVFDILMFGILIYLFDAGANVGMFQTGWFLETMLAQMLLIFVIRTRKIPFLQSRPSAFLSGMCLLVLFIAFALPYSPLAMPLGLVHMPLFYYPALAVLSISYLVIVWIFKNWFLDKFDVE